MSKEIYTLEFCQQETEDLLKTLIWDENIITVAQLLSNKSYSQQRYYEWVKKYTKDRKDEEYSESIKENACKIVEIVEWRKQVWALTWKLNATFTIFDLKNNHGWKDRQEVDQTSTNLNFDKDISHMSDDELNALLNKLD